MNAKPEILSDAIACGDIRALGELPENATLVLSPDDLVEYGPGVTGALLCNDGAVWITKWSRPYELATETRGQRECWIIWKPMQNGARTCAKCAINCAA